MPVSKKFWATLNGGWPKDMTMPLDATVINGVKRLVRHIQGKPLGMRVVITHHRHRRTWAARSTRGTMIFQVAPNYPFPKPGWPAIVHDLSHYLHSRMPYNGRPRRPHDSRQARIEKALQQYVIEHLL